MEKTLASDRAGGMSRRSQTIWICGTLCVLAAIGGTVWATQPDPNDPFAECDSFLGGRDTKCAADIASRRIMGPSFENMEDEEFDQIMEDMGSIDAAVEAAVNEVPIED